MTRATAWDMGDADLLHIGTIVLAITLVLGAGLLAERALRRRPAAQHFVLLVSLIFGLAAPAVVVAFRGSGTRLVGISLPVERDAESMRPLSLMPHHDGFSSSAVPFPDEPTSDKGLAARTAPSVAGEARTAAVETPKPLPSDSVKSPVQRSSDLRPRFANITLATWLIGVAGMLLRLGRRYLRLGRMLRRSLPVGCAEANAELRQVSARLGLKRAPDFRCSGELRTPIACGVLHPTVVLPAQLLRELDPEQLRDVLVHEVAHLRRRDPLVLVLQAIGGCLYWPIPLLHLLNRQLGRAREEICDNFVLASRDPIRYGRTLLQVAELACGPRPPHAAVGVLHWRGDLERRIAGLIDRQRDIRTAPGRVASAAIVVGFLAFGVAVCGTELVAVPQQAAGAEDQVVTSGADADESDKTDVESDGANADSEPQGNSGADFNQPTGSYEKVSAEAPTLAAITQGWKQTQEKVRSGRFQWETDQWLAKGSQTPPGSDATIPEDDTTLTHNKTFAFSNAKVRYEDAGPVWDVGNKQRVKRKQILTWDGEAAMRYNGDANAPNALLYDVNIALATESDVRPIQFAVRMFHPEWYTFDENKFVVSEEPVSIDGLECWSIEYSPEVIQQQVAKGRKPLTPIYTICPERNYAVVRYAAINKATGQPTLTMEINQTLDEEFSVWVPSKWTITHHGSVGPLKRATSTVRDYALNQQVPESAFSVDLPPGTTVSDMRSNPNAE